VRFQAGFIIALPPLTAAKLRLALSLPAIVSRNPPGFLGDRRGSKSPPALIILIPQRGGFLGADSYTHLTSTDSNLSAVKNEEKV